MKIFDDLFVDVNPKAVFEDFSHEAKSISAGDLSVKHGTSGNLEISISPAATVLPIISPLIRNSSMRGPLLP